MTDKTVGKVSACCGRQLIGTLLFSGAESYCTVCGSTYGMVGTPERIVHTEQVAEQYKVDEQHFSSVATFCIAPGMRLHKGVCTKCDAGEDHIHHATDEQMRQSARAYEALKGGVYNNPEWYKAYAEIMALGAR